MSNKISMEDWRRVGDFEKVARPGDEVELDVVQAFIDAVPPIILKAELIQAGEPYSCELDPDTGYWHDTFTTFKRESGHWIYCGHCFRNKTEEPKRLGEGFLV